MPAVSTKHPLLGLVFYGFEAHWDCGAPRRPACHEAHPAIGDAVLPPQERVDVLVRRRIWSGAILARPATSLDRHHCLGFQPTDPCRLWGAVVQPGLPSLIDDPEPRLVHRPSGSPFVQDDDLAAHFD